MYLSNSNQKLWVSNLIGDDYKEWYREFIGLNCGTGAGKTYFSFHVLSKYAQEQKKKVLYLCNRSKLRNDNYEQVKRLGLEHTVWVTTYQTLQKELKREKWNKEFDYIIADECHYFTTDALFNGYTDISYHYLMNQKDSVVIWLSATATTFFNYLKNSGKVKPEYMYNMPKDYFYVQNLYIYQEDELVSLVNEILEDETRSKIVIFCNSKERMLYLASVFNDRANYFCSNNCKDTTVKDLCGYDIITKKIFNKKSKKIEDKSDKRVKDCIIHKTVNNEEISTFEKRILITTTVLDNGIDLKDRNIKHIFNEIFDVDSMLQSFGRKRPLDDKDTCKFYLKEWNKRAVNTFLNGNEYQLDPVVEYKNDYNSFYERYSKNRERLNKLKIFYAKFREDKSIGTIAINNCRLIKYKMDNIILKDMKEKGYLPVVLNILGDYLSSIAEVVTISPEELDSFIEYLKSMEGKPLYKEDQKRLKAEFERVGLKARYASSINTYNGALEDNYKTLYTPRFSSEDANGKKYVDYRRKLEDGSPNPNRNKAYWILS